jgi:streptogramin lyase
MNVQLKTILLILGVVLIGHLGCTTKKEAKPPVPDYGVVESFNTGQGVIVRALKVDGPYLWVGTSTGILQVDRVSGELVKTYTKQDGLMSDYIFTINVSQDGVRWFGTDAGGLSRFDGEVWKTYMPEDGLSDEWVYDIDYDRNGAMWVGTWDGVSRFDGTGFTTYRVKDGLANKWVYSVAADDDGTLWFGTEEGVSHFDPNAPSEHAWTTYTHQNGLGAPNDLALSRKKTAGEVYDESQKNIELAPGRSYEGHFHDLNALDEAGNETYNENYVFSILVDRDGNKWFGTWGGGATRFDGKTWKNFTIRDGLAGNIVYALEEDLLGQIWAGTHRGVSVYDGTSWKSYTQTNGLRGSDVFSVALDPDQGIWVGQSGGVVQLRPKQG